MEWVRDFYDLHQRWLAGYYLGPILDQHRDQAATVHAAVGLGPKRVLELGAGGSLAAAATADLGHEVVAVELVPAGAAHARMLASRPERGGSLSVIEGDFYRVELAQTFDVVCYWDGFGIGSDADQRRLLRRMGDWLAPDGRAVIDIFTPWHAVRMAGREVRFDRLARRYGFDPEGCRLIDSW